MVKISQGSACIQATSWWSQPGIFVPTSTIWKNWQASNCWSTLRRSTLSSFTSRAGDSILVRMLFELVSEQCRHVGGLYSLCCVSSVNLRVGRVFLSRSPGPHPSLSVSLVFSFGWFLQSANHLQMYPHRANMTRRHDLVVFQMFVSPIWTSPSFSVWLNSNSTLS